ncbi:hypothetical protein B7486_10065 [cyanobacterium TDX16]|nr:hypothetical protein B7486_10065 [cyanobacterium TDX16]
MQFLLLGSRLSHEFGSCESILMVNENVTYGLVRQRGGTERRKSRPINVGTGNSVIDIQSVFFDQPVVYHCVQIGHGRANSHTKLLGTSQGPLELLFET